VTITTALPTEVAAPAADPRTGPRHPALRRSGLRLLAIVTLLGLWQLAASSGRWSPVFVPSPSEVWHQLLLTSSTHDGVRGYGGTLLVEHLWTSLRRILIGSALGIIGGIGLGVVMGTVTWVRVVLEPLVTFVRALPPLAYFSLLIIWFGIDETPKIWLLTVAALPPVAVATTSAIAAAPQQLVEAVRALGGRRLQVIATVVLPAALPEIFTGVRLAVGIAYSSVVAAETVNGLPGIGGMVRDAQRYNSTDVVLLGLFAIGLSGLALDGCLRLLERRLVPWRGRA
jgi:taurine transport system permease protein